MKFLKEHKILIIFFIFFLFVFLQHQFLWLYHDDYGYAALTYVNGYIPNAYGYNTTIAQIFSFLQNHYLNWGGRVLYYFIECLLLKYGLFPYRLFQSLVITGIFYMIYKITVTITKKDDWKVALFSVLCYGLIEIMTFRTSIFWISASITYVIPLLPFFMFIYFYTIREKKIKNKILYYVLNGILIFLSTFSQEQVSAMALCYIGLFTLYNLYKTKKFNLSNFIMTLVGLSGFLILMLAPGNRSRMDTNSDFYSLSILEKFYKNIQEILFNCFGAYTRIFFIVFCIAICYIAYKCMTNKYGNKILNKISFVSNILILTFTLCNVNGYYSYIYQLTSNSILKKLIIIVFIIQLLLIIYSVINYFYNKKENVYIYLFISALASQVVMLVAPYYPLRSTIVFEIPMFLIFSYVFSDIYINLKYNKNIYYIIIPIFCVAVLNYGTITYGYYKNSKVNKQNDLILRDASKKIKKGIKLDEIKLRKLKDVTYSGEQPYIDDFDYILYWLKDYYNIPDSVEITYHK